MAQVMKGTVVSNAMKNTVIVSVEATMRHPMYKKVVSRTKRFKAHVEGTIPEVGTSVTIAACRPISKDKHFIVIEG